MNNIKSILSTKSNKSLIKAIEDILVDAKNGHIKAFAGTCEMADNNIDTYLLMPDYESSLPLLGGLTRISHDINIAKDEQEDSGDM